MPGKSKHTVDSEHMVYAYSFRRHVMSRFDCLFYPDLVCFEYSPRPYSRAVRDLRIGPNCLGSPASTSKPPLGWLGSRRSATGMMHSGSVACPASSMKMWLKWLRGNFAETNLGRDKGWRQALWQHTWEMMVEVVGGWGVLWRLGWEDIGLFCFHLTNIHPHTC